MPGSRLIQNTERQPNVAVSNAPISGPVSDEMPQTALRLP